MDYGGVSEAEQEVIVRLDRLDGQAHVCSTWPAWSRKLERLYGSPKRITEQVGKMASALWTIPLNLVTLRRPRRASRLQSASAAASPGCG